jgi:hypothetical protein
MLLITKQAEVSEKLDDMQRRGVFEGMKQSLVVPSHSGQEE